MLRFFCVTAVVLTLSILGLTASDKPTDKATSITLLVMDPLAADLSCPCVKGYAQRDYPKLGKQLEAELKRPVTVAFSESIKAGLERKTQGMADIIIGKHSIITHECPEMKLKMQPVASLTGKDGDTNMKGLFVVANADPAKTVADLKGYRIIFGNKDADEKHTAALDLLKVLEVPVAEKKDCCGSCSDGATAVLEAHKKGEKVATVISSYAQPLLEGCGTVKKGDLRVIGATEPVPFVTAFVNESLSAADQEQIRLALMTVAKNEQLCTAMETKAGFVPFKKK